jgi:hypothetical protein
MAERYPLWLSAPVTKRASVETSCDGLYGLLQALLPIPGLGCVVVWTVRVSAAGLVGIPRYMQRV